MSNLRHATLTWTSGLAFTGGAAGGTQITVDGDGVRGISPMITLLCAAAGCSGADVVSILEKMRVGLQAFRIEITGTRREEEPKRYLALHLVYHITATAIDQVKAKRAIDLSIEKYCSVMASLAPDIAISYDVQLG
jgi:putative redox protein